MRPQARLGHYRGRPAKTPATEEVFSTAEVWRKQAAVNELRRTESVLSESAVLVGVFLGDQGQELVPLEELEGLAEAAGTQVVGKLTQRREAPDAATYLGKGKVQELAALAHAEMADVIIFDNDLSPGQTRNLEKATGLKVLDRTELILDIFASRAQTHEARLAVELAQLEYQMPRLKRMWTHLSRQAQGGVGLRGPGEKQLEVDRRLAEKRVTDLRKQLRMIEHRRQREVAARQTQMTVSLVGYTNAGKSTLLNALTGSDVFTKDLLFATLDTRTRRWQLPGWGPVLLSDTVGFIRDLPHHLIASFRATLEEARQANLLLHVADAANPAVVEQVAAAYKVIEELGHRAERDVAGVEQGRRPSRPNPPRRPLEPLSQRHPRKCPFGVGHGEPCRGGERGLEPQFSRRQRGNGRRQRPHAGLSGRSRQGALEDLSRFPGGGPLPHLAALHQPHGERRGCHPAARER